MLHLVRLPSCAAIREVQAEVIKEAAPIPSGPMHIPTPTMNSQPAAPSMWHNLAGMGGRRWAGLGALAGGALGALMPGKDEDGESRGAISGALRGALAGGLAGGLGGMAAKRFAGPKGPMATMQQATQGAQGLAANQAQHEVGLAGAQQGLSHGLGQHVYNPGSYEALRQQGHGVGSALWGKFNPFGGQQRLQARVDTSRDREMKQMIDAQRHQLDMSHLQAGHQQAMGNVDPAAAAATANAQALHHARGTALNKMIPNAGIDHTLMTHDQLNAHIPQLVAGGHITPQQAAAVGHVAPAAPQTPPTPPGPTVDPMHAARVQAATAAGFTNAQHMSPQQVEAALHHAHGTGKISPLDMVNMGLQPRQQAPQQPNPNPGAGISPNLHRMHANNAAAGGSIPKAVWAAMSPAQQQQIHQAAGGNFAKFSSVLRPASVFSVTKLAARRPFTAPKQTVADRVQGAFAPRKAKSDHAPVAAAAAEPPKAVTPDKPKAAETPADEDDDKKKTAAAAPVAAPEAAKVAEPLPPAVVAAPAAEPAKEAEVPQAAAVAAPVIKTVKLAALAA